MKSDSELKIFSGSSNRPFAQAMCDYLGVEMGKSRVITFSEGNTYVKIDEKIRGNDVFLVQTVGLDPNNEFMELLFWIDAFKRSGVGEITALIPFFSYAKADKKDEPRVSIRARVCADCLETAGVDRVITMDLHSAQVQGFFKKPVDNLMACKMFGDVILEKGFENYVIVSPDEGYAKDARYYSNRLKVPLAIGNKIRNDHSERAEILGVMGDVRGKNAIIVDDFTISCGTLKEIAQTLEKNGAKDIYAFVSHAPLSEKGIDTLRSSAIKRLYTTDTIDNPLLHGCDRIEILSVASLFAKAVRIIHDNDSLSELFLGR